MNGVLTYQLAIQGKEIYHNNHFKELEWDQPFKYPEIIENVDRNHQEV